ncbi:TPA: peptidylprolyl isomerase [Escherichia coli]|nr:peptidylprolyl isomerase [Escherichia coli]
MRQQIFICVLLLSGSTVGRAVAADPECSSGGCVPEILKYAQQYQQEVEEKAARGKGENVFRSVTSLWWSLLGSISNAELSHRLTLREQELRQMKKERHILLDRLNTLLGVTEVSADKDRELVKLKMTLTENQKQLSDLTRRAEQVQEELNVQVLELKQQLVRTEAEGKAGLEQVRKEKTELVSLLNILQKEMAEMPVVTPELLKTESEQQTYAAGVMLGRNMLNIQVAQQQLGLNTNNRVLLAGIRDALNRNVLLNESTLDSALQKAEEMAQKAYLAVIREQKKAGAAYLSNFRKQKNVRQAKSGFWYRIEYAGDGEFIRGDDTQVDVVVTEKLTDGTVIEDMDVRGQVISMALRDYPPVFREALILLKNHGTAELVVPAEQAYGDEGYFPRVPPGATMLYTLRVEGVKLAEGDNK